MRGETVRLSDVRRAVCLAAFLLLTARAMVLGEFLTLLRCARNDRERESFEERVLRFEEAETIR